MRGPEPAQRVLRLGIALLDGRPVEHLAAAGLVDLVEHDVAHRVAVDEGDARVVRSPRRHVRAVLALPDHLGGPRREVDTHRALHGLLPRLDREEGDLGVVVDLDQVRATTRERLGRQRLGKATLERDDVRHVVLVAVGVDHDEDQAEPGKDVEELAADEVRVLERHLRREQGLGHAAGGVHRVQAQVP